VIRRRVARRVEAFAYLAFGTRTPPRAPRET
jgi:hypothetical protein